MKEGAVTIARKTNARRQMRADKCAPTKARNAIYPDKCAQAKSAQTVNNKFQN